MLTPTQQAALERCLDYLGTHPNDDYRDEMLRLLAGGNPNNCDEFRCTALHMADSVELAALLLDAGANIDAQDNVDDTTLHLACDADNVPLARLLLERGANPNIRGMTGQVPLFRTRNVDIAELLLAHGADPNAEDVDGWVPLHMATAEVTRLLLAHGANPMLGDGAGATPLSQTDDPHKIRLLREYGAHFCEDDFFDAALDHNQHEGELEAWLAAHGERLRDMPRTPEIVDALREGKRRDERYEALMREINNNMPAGAEEYLRELMK